MFSETRIALAREVRDYHPELVVLLQQYKPDDWGKIIGEIAAYCLVLMDGNYYESELERLYEILLMKLQAKRIISVIPTAANIIKH